MISPDDKLKSLFDQAVIIARDNKHEYITLEHLLYTIVTDPMVAELCKETKSVKYDSLVKDLHEHIEKKLNEKQKITRKFFFK